MPISAAVDPSAIARVTGIETKFSDLRAGRVVFLPQRIAVVGQGATAATFVTTKAQVTSALEVGQTYGFGSPLHLAVKQLMPSNGDGVGTIPVTVYPLADDGAGVASVGAILPTGAATAAGSFRYRIGGVLSKAISVASGDNVAAIVAAIETAINAETDVPVVALDITSTSVSLTSKWKGASANGIFVEIVGEAPAGVTLGLTQPVAGATDPDVQTALDQFGDVWETLVLNCVLADTTTMDLYSVFGDARWGALTRKPLVVFTGATEPVLASAIALSDSRTTDRVNARLSAPGSPDLPLMVAARQLARIAVVANGNPPRDYAGQDASGINPGTDGEQWDYTERDVAVKAGTSTSAVNGGVVNIEDVVTFYHPVGDATPAYRYVVDIVKLMQVIFNLDLIFASGDWNGAPLIPDNQPTVNRSAKQPKTAVAAVCAMLDSLGLEAIISDPDTAKANTAAEIDGSNPKRLNVATVVQLSGNTNIISVDLNFGFYFGG